MPKSWRGQEGTRWVLFALLGWALSCQATMAGAVEPVVWDFRSAESVWTPRAKSVSVDRVEVPGSDGKSTAALSIRGRMDKNWNYACSKPVSIEPGRLYRVSAWARVDRRGSGTPMPYLKCEFQSVESKRSLGQSNTERYDSGKPRTWQRLTGEFRAPAGATSCWLALEKGTTEPTEIEAYLADVRLEPIARWGFYDNLVAMCRAGRQFGR